MLTQKKISNERRWRERLSRKDDREKKSIESILDAGMLIVGRTTKKKNWGTQNEDKYVCRVRAHARMNQIS